MIGLKEYDEFEVDNFDAVERLMEFQTQDDFYHVEFIRRAKDGFGPGGSFGSLFITYAGQLELLMDEVRCRCSVNGCRAYVNLNPKSIRKTAFGVMGTLVKGASIDYYGNLFSVLTSEAARCQTQPRRKTVLVDVDVLDGEKPEGAMGEVMEAVRKCRRSDMGSDPIVAVLRTMNGLHVVSRPFDISEFNGMNLFKHCKVEVKTNSPTLLYAKRT